jgi:hypothetical protein
MVTRSFSERLFAPRSRSHASGWDLQSAARLNDGFNYDQPIVTVYIQRTELLIAQDGFPQEDVLVGPFKPLLCVDE